MLNNLRRDDGFTLPEVIMVVAVMAIVSAMAFPDIVSFFKRQSFEQEKLVQSEIIKALDAYSKAQTAAFADDPDNMITVPLGINAIGAGGVYEVNDPAVCAAAGGWGEMLANLSNLSSQDICNDVWGNPRVYTVAQGDLSYRDGNFRTYYVTLLSKGENKTLDTTTPWTDVNSYGSFKPEGDDLISKFSDVKLKTELFEETLRRMERVVEALDRYAQSRYNEALLTYDETQQELITYQLFYPAENSDYNDTSGRPAIVSGAGEWYGQRVLEDVQGASGGNALASGNDSPDVRRGGMEALMRIIGLPQEFCCNALTGEPFYYYSNPIIRASSGMPCVRRVQPPYMPPKLTIDPLDCN